MKKIFISQPTKGRTDDELLKERKELFEFAKEKLGDEVEIVGLTLANADPGRILGESLKNLSAADACIFAEGYEDEKFCVELHKACERCGISVYEYGNPDQNDGIKPRDDDDCVREKNPFKPTFNLEKTITGMMSADHKQRFVAEYLQTKIRYEKLKAMTTKYLVTNETGKDYLGFKPSCPLELLTHQQRCMGEYLACLEQRAVIEDIELPTPYTNW